MSRLKKGGLAAVLSVGLISSAEGLRLNAYSDPATGREPWTICYGETAGVKRGDRHTLAECKAILAASLDGYATKMEACITRPLPDTTYAAFLSLSYNIGAGGFCRSSVARLWNAGQGRAACDAMMKFNRAAGVVFAGLTRRRAEERDLCLKGI